MKLEEVKDYFKNADKVDWEKIIVTGDWALRDSDGNCIFCNGKWATIIRTLTKKEAEEKLGVKII